ncbi:MAG: hypothetical protein ACK4WM_04405 [Thermoflexales bacterium]
MALGGFPLNTCPLCRQLALDQRGTLWKCEFCGCELEFDPISRRARLTYVPPAYAAVGEAVGSDWLSRREMFRRADAAPLAAPPTATGRTLAVLLIVAAVLLTVLILLIAVAAALLISPDVSRTRRLIVAAYQPTATPSALAVAARMTPTPTQPVVATVEPPIDQATALPTQPAEGTATAPKQVSEGAPQEQSPQRLLPTSDLSLPTPPEQFPPEQLLLAPSPTPPLDVLPVPIQPPGLSPLATPTPSATFTPLPPTFTPIPPSPTAIAASPTPLPPAPTPTSASPAAGATPTPLPFGSVIFRGSIQVYAVKTQGDPSLNEADEYIEIRNTGNRPVLLGGWVMGIYQPADATRASHEFVFDGDFVMVGGQACRLYTNLPFGLENCGLRGFGASSGILPITGARASLFDEQGNEMSRLTW